MNMQNRLVHHLISTRLHCALAKCTLVQNYIENLDLHVRCQAENYYIMHPCPYAPSVYARCEILERIWDTFHNKVPIGKSRNKHVE